MFEFIDRHCAQGIDAKAAGTAQIEQSFFYVAPVGVLREVRANNHFKARTGRPPILWAVAGEKGSVVMRNFRPGDPVIG